MSALMKAMFRRKTGEAKSLAPRRASSRLQRQLESRLQEISKSLPRGAGLMASAAFLVGFGAYGMVLSGRTMDVINDTASELGFRVSAVRITGQRELNESDVLDTLSIHSRQSLFLYDAEAARDRLASIPWVSNVSVMKLYPDKLRVILEERIPAALWQRSVADNAVIIDGAGKVITDHFEARFSKLPRVIGEGAETRVSEIMSILDDTPELSDKVRASMLVSKRRWDLFMDNGVQVMLPESDPGKALAELARLDREGGLLDRDITVVDLRLNDRVVMRLSDTAKKARDELIEERNKALKKRAREA